MNHCYNFPQRLKQFSLILLIAQLSACATNEKPPLSLSSAAHSDNQNQGNRQAVSEALQLQGQPYVPGGKSPDEGFDCSGLIVYIYKKQGLMLPRDTRSLASQLPSVGIDQRLPGDLLFFTIDTKPFAHVGIYVGEDKFVHAPSSHTGRVMISDLNQPYWRKRFTAVRRPVFKNPLSFNDTVEHCRID